MTVPNPQIVVTVNGQEFRVEILDLNATPVIAVVDGQPFEVFIGEGITIRPHETAVAGEEQREAKIALATSTNQTTQGTSDPDNRFRVTAPMPGDIVEVCVQPGQKVKLGDALCVLDAMKMKNTIHSPRDGLISSVDVSPGQVVEYGDLIVTYG